MPVKSSIALLLHLLLAGWVGFALSGSILGIHHRKDFSSKKIHDPLVTRIRRSRNVYEPNDFKFLQPSLSIRRAPVNAAVKLRDSVLLECDARGTPQPAIHWLKDGVEIFQDESLFTNEMPSVLPSSLNGFGITKSRLYIDCMSPKDEGVYTCVADTPYQRVSEASYIFLSRDLPVEVSASCLPQKMSLALGQNGEPARIHMWTSKLLQDMGSDVVLFCRATGEPTPSVKWTRTDDDETEEVISNGSKYQVMVVTAADDRASAEGEIVHVVTMATHEPTPKLALPDVLPWLRHGHSKQVLDNGDLLIRLATWSEKGLYKCIAKNVYGEDSTSTFFYPTKADDK